MLILGLIIGIVISSLWIFIPYKRVKEDIKIEKKYYIRSILTGMTLTTLAIMILEILWDAFMPVTPSSMNSMLEVVIVSFCRAALIEETIKYLFVSKVLKKHKVNDPMQYMLLSGTIGMGYGIMEKLVSGSAFSLILNSFFALHILFEFVMGDLLYKAEYEQGNRLKALLVPILLHGLWDTLLNGSTLLMNKEGIYLSIGAVIVIITCIIGIVYQIYMVRYLKKVSMK